MPEVELRCDTSEQQVPKRTRPTTASPDSSQISTQTSLAPCGGDWCGIRISDKLFKLPADVEEPEYKRLRLEEPDIMPYFIRMREGYQKLLSDTVEHIRAARAGNLPRAVTLDMGHQVLLVADRRSYCRQCIKEWNRR